MKIQNIIATAALGHTVNVKKFNNFSWGKYSPELYRGKCGYIKDSSMQGRVSVFFSGKMISTGANSLDQSKYQLLHSAILIKQAGLLQGKVLAEISPKIQNIVALENFGQKININELSLMLPSSYLEPESFPGLVHKSSFDTTCLIFASGKMVITGGKSVSQLESSIQEISKFIDRFGLYVKPLPLS